MGGYIANFTVYTMAMTGLICFAVFIYKKVMDGSMRSNNTNFLSIEESMSLSPRKSLHVVRAGNEKFLIASDIDRTTLISKLNNSEHISQKIINRYEQLEEAEDFRKNFEQVYTPAARQQNHQAVHLEPIKTPPKSKPKQQMDNRIHQNYPANKNSKTVVLDFDKPNNHGFSTMKEMAKKINEL